MRLKLNAYAMKEMCIYRDNISVTTIAGISGQSVSALASGVDIGGGNHSPGFIESLTGGGYGATTVKGLFVYKGAMPTQTELDSYIVAAGNNVVDGGVLRASDLLAKFNIQATSVAQGSILNTFAPALATGTGQASWFVFGVYASNSYTSRPSYLVIGSITAAGGGGDIEMLSLNFVAGTAYRLPPYELKLPSKFNV